MANKRTKFTDLEKKTIIADYVDCQNYSEVAKKNNVSVEAIRRIVNEDDDIVKKLETKKQENTQTTIEYMQTQHETKKRILDKILNAIEKKSEDIDMFTNIKDLATAYGIILDKELKVLELQRNKSEMEAELTKLDLLLGEIRKDAND